jgi:hypothetical protein
MSTLKLDKITGRLGVGGENSPITLSGDTVTLGSGVTFPSGHIIQTKTDTYDMPEVVITTTADDHLGSNLEVTITPSSTSNILLVNCFIPKGYNYGVAGRSINSGFRYDADFSGNGTQLGEAEFIGASHGSYNAAVNLVLNLSYQTSVSAPVDTAIKIRPWLQSEVGNYRMGGAGIASLVVHEIVG